MICSLDSIIKNKMTISISYKDLLKFIKDIKSYPSDTKINKISLNISDCSMKKVDKLNHYKCSNCKSIVTLDEIDSLCHSNYCPNCGSRIVESTYKL